MAGDPKIEAQLDQVVARIRQGAKPWKIRDQDIAALKKHYRPSFSLNASSWTKVRGKILRLSSYEGALAAVFAEALYGKLATPARPMPNGCLFLAAFLVQLGCPPELAPTAIALGRHCTKVDLSLVDAKTLKSIGQRLLTLASADQYSAAVG